MNEEKKLKTQDAQTIKCEIFLNFIKSEPDIDLSFEDCIEIIRNISIYETIENQKLTIDCEICLEKKIRNKVSFFVSIYSSFIKLFVT
jgi:hypothetical protein